MTEVVCAIIINSESKVFAARRAPGKSFEGYWEFPGGKVEAGEETSAALIREIKEELSVNINPAQSLHTVEWENKSGAFRLEAFLCKDDLPGLDLQAHDEWGWFSVEELLELEMLVADLALLPYLERYLKDS